MRMPEYMTLLPRRLNRLVVSFFLFTVVAVVVAACALQAEVKADLDTEEWRQQLLLSSVVESEELQQHVAERVQTQWLDWTDQQRQREVPSLLFMPAQSDNKRIPLVVFSHGLGGSRDRYTYLGQHWASQGIASLHVQHVGSDRKVWNGSRLLLPFRLRSAVSDEEALARVSDVKFALDQLLVSAYATNIDVNKIVVAGHSYGANTAMLLTGAEVERDNRPIRLRDPRFVAAVLISAPPFYDDQPLEEILQPLKVPSLHITSTLDETKVPGFYSAAEDRLAVYQAVGSPFKVMAIFYGGSHGVFSGRPPKPERVVQDRV
ncbi:MAG TPA: alpha/beta fold hydrolase, partial [Dongiaceae bacterium]|nr:alpha/beta fold hydrolase [Dongiaceae bacterium]